MVRLDVRREMGREVFASLRFDRQKAKCNDFGLRLEDSEPWKKKKRCPKKVLRSL